jgi:hypothetical protein
MIPPKIQSALRHLDILLHSTKDTAEEFWGLPPPWDFNRDH